MKRLIVIVAVLSLAVMAGRIFMSMRSARQPGKAYEWRADPKVWDYHRKEMAQIHARLGRAPKEILAKQGTVERHTLFDALQTLCSWKSLNNEPLTELEQFIVVSTGLGMEVNNGGFHQYFFNSAADDWDIMLEGIRKAGDEDGVKRFEAVLGRFPNGRPSRIRSERWKQLDSFGEAQYKLFDPDTTAFYDAPFPDWEKIWVYIAAHTDQIQPSLVEPIGSTNGAEPIRLETN